MRIAVLLALVASCAPSARDPEDEWLTGCDDPRVWTAPIPELAEARSFLGGEAPCTAQFPIARAMLEWNPTDPHDVGLLDSAHVCWRVTKASPGSGWTEGQTFETWMSSGTMNLKGFAQPVTVEGRVLRADNSLAFGLGPMSIELRPRKIVLPDASAVIAVMSADSWAERDAVQLWGERIATDEVVDAGQIQFADAFTLHRIGGNLVRRTWSRSTGSIEYTDLVIGPGTTGRITKWGNAAVVDNELVLFGRDSSDSAIVRDRIALTAAPLEVAENGSTVTLHLPGMLASYDIVTSAARTLAVGDGVLVPTFQDSLPLFFDGTGFRVVSRTATELKLNDSYKPSAEDLAKIGKPIAENDSVIIGERGFLATHVWNHSEPAEPGPSAATYAELYGDGRLGPLSSDSAAYVMVHDDGSAQLYAAPFGGFCVPI